MLKELSPDLIPLYKLTGVFSTPIESTGVVEHIENRGLHPAVRTVGVDIRVDRLCIEACILAFEDVGLREVRLESSEVTLLDEEVPRECSVTPTMKSV